MKSFKGIDKTQFTPQPSPFFFVHEKEGIIQICIDFRMLNKQIKINVHPIPWIEEILDHLCKARIFSTINLRYITRLLLNHYSCIRQIFLLSMDCSNFQSYCLDWLMHQFHSNGWSIPLFNRHSNIICQLSLMTCQCTQKLQTSMSRFALDF